MTQALPRAAAAAAGRAVGPAVAFLGLGPFLAARFLWHPVAGGGVDGPGLGGVCPLLETTGVPCAGCGATRAVYGFAHGDPGFLHYNWGWVLALLGLVAYGAAVARRTWRGGALLGKWDGRFIDRVRAQPWLAGAVTVAFVASAWGVAMLNLGSIDAA